MTHKKIKVIIADDHDLFRDGLRHLLEADNELEVCAEACNGRELVELACRHKPDVILTDLVMPEMDAIGAIKELYTTFSRDSLKIAVISTFDSDALIVQALMGGAIGYISKTARRSDIVAAVKSVYKGDPYYCRSTDSRLKHLISASAFNPYKNTKQPPFTDVEREVIRYIIEEKSTLEMCDLLLQSKRNVDRLRSGVLAKMKVRTGAGVAIYAVKNGLYIIEP